MNGPDQAKEMGTGKNPGEDKPNRRRHAELVTDEKNPYREAEYNYEIG